METEIGGSKPDLPMSGIKNKMGPFNDIKDFIKAVKGAKAGDWIILANGTYDVDEDKDTRFIDLHGTADNPILVTAEEVGNVILKGKHSSYIFKNCEHVTWYGFKHIHKSAEEGNNILFDGGNNNRLSNCEINLHDDDKEKRLWVRISNCKSMKVDHCFFHHKISKGQFCNVKFRGQHNNPGEGPLFEYNHFLHQDYPDTTGDGGGEAIQMGDSKLCRWCYRAIFRYNYFEECNGDGEIITNKSCGNIYYNNSFVNNNGSLTLRHGDSTAVLCNYFEGNNGLRVCGANNLIANNHFTLNSNRENNRHSLVIMNGTAEKPKKQGAEYERVVNNDIILNTFANGTGTAEVIVRWGARSETLKPTDNRFRGNIITGENGKLLEFNNGATAIGDSDRPNKITDNIGWATGRAKKGDLSSDMATLDKDPILTKDSDGIHRVQSGSPAHNKFEGTPFEELTDMDIDGEERGPNTDAGCDQFSTASTKPKRRITPADVGPNATTNLGASPDWNPRPLVPQPQDEEDED